MKVQFSVNIIQGITRRENICNLDTIFHAHKFPGYKTVDTAQLNYQNYLRISH